WLAKARGIRNPHELLPYLSSGRRLTPVLNLSTSRTRRSSIYMPNDDL
ncbi:24532_t:CDS:1, partial [Dentiscutata erythropus]